MQRSGWWLAPLVAVVLVAACNGSTPATEAPSEPTAAPVETAGTGYAPDTLLSVIEGPLRVRSKPSVEDDSVKFTPLLDSGQRLFVISGPVEGSGYVSWYLVHPLGGATPNGWASAAARDGTPWLEPAAADCPPVLTLSDLGRMDPALRILCAAGRELTFTTTVTWGANCGDANELAKPDWMAGCLSTFRWGGKDSTVVVAVPPDLAGAVGDNQLGDTYKATVTAHLDDPAALTCEPKTGLQGEPVIVAATVVLDCRAMFVATVFDRQ
jgi:hypothetical protein